MQSNHLLIRPSTFEDCTLFAKWEAQPYIIEFFTISQGRDYNEIAQEFVKRTLDSSMLQLTIVMKDEDKPIGRVFISRLDQHADSLDITRIYIGEDSYRGKGLGEEALRLLLEYCFIYLHMERVTLDHVPENRRAANLYLKLGFQYEGIARHAGKKDGKYVDLHLMSMLRSEYFKNMKNGDL
ncbi:GNAT family N-acetyltransferase [Anaerovorax sp. IOR16]|uniref:GNAT family N-acetyltransferase n=1 Tax=Anaerovorax sp. IOR16 TaxID=2773458 RepID=UPI0019D30991|nr:GNAT family protein [Anaerovorax sp. IOR16]